jgi:hypothetical protein
VNELLRIRLSKYDFLEPTRHSFTLYQQALLQCLTLVQADPLRYRKICAVPLAPSHIFVVRATGSLTL